jgi:hypothetical protein
MTPAKQSKSASTIIPPPGPDPAEKGKHKTSGDKHSAKKSGKKAETETKAETKKAEKAEKAAKKTEAKADKKSAKADKKPKGKKVAAEKSAKASAGKKPGKKPRIDAISPELRHRLINEEAYRRAERRGFAGGSPEGDWAEAEVEIDRRLSGESN